MSSRRSFIKQASWAGIGLGFARPKETADFSFLHLTDMHVQRKRQGNIGYQACVDTVNKNERDADFVLMGGDLAFDGNYTAKEIFIDQINLYKGVSDQLKMPYYNALGNHDILGWNARSKISVDDPDSGKKLIMDMLDMRSSYYSFNHKGWHFVILDSMLPVTTDQGPSYKAGFGEEQLEWLRFDLGQHHGMPTVLLTHIAAFCHLAQMNGNATYNAIGHMVVQDTLDFRRIIERHNVKAVLQGHSHVPEDYFFNGVWYITSQSVSAAWWGGNWKGFLPGYTRFQVSGDTLKWDRRSFPWQHYLEPEDSLERKRIAEREAFEADQHRLQQEEINHH